MNGNPYSNPGSFDEGYENVHQGEGLGLYDMFNTYSHIQTLFSDTAAGDQVPLQGYDPYSENLMRQQYREDYRSMVGDLTQFQRDQFQESQNLSAQTGRFGFAGSGAGKSQQKNFQQTLQNQQKKMTGQLSNRREKLLGNIQGEREKYNEGLWSAYGAWLSQTPNQISTTDYETTNACMDDGGFIDANGECQKSSSQDYQDEFSLWQQGEYQRDWTPFESVEDDD